MNDCFWALIDGVCNCGNCINCKDYISVNTDSGQELLNKYNADVAQALKPVSDKWKKIKEE